MNDTGRTVLVMILVLIALPLLWGTVMMGTMGPGMMGGWDGWGGSWSPWRGLLSMLSALLVIGGLAAIGWWAFVRGGGNASPPAGRDARSILDERYARGELAREQYQQMRRDLES